MIEEASFDLGAFDVVATSGTTSIIRVLGFSRTHGDSVSPAVVVHCCLRVVGHAKGVSGLTAINAKVRVRAGEVDGFATVADLDVIWSKGELSIESGQVRSLYDLLSKTWADSVSPPKMQLLR